MRVQSSARHDSCIGVVARGTLHVAGLEAFWPVDPMRRAAIGLRNRMTSGVDLLLLLLCVEFVFESVLGVVVDA